MGVAVIVFVTALISGLQANVIDRTLGTQAHIRVEAPREVNRLARAGDGVLQLVLEDPRPQSLRPIDNWLEVRDVLDRLPGITAVSPLVSGPAFGRRGDAVESVALVGIDPPRYLRVIPLDAHMVEGQLRVGSGSVLVRRILGRPGLLGGKLRLEAGDGRDAIVTIAGIFELGVATRFAIRLHRPRAALLALPGGVTVIDLTVEKLFEADQLAARVRGS